jgi:sugar phosphate isomerase/epimerase
MIEAAAELGCRRIVATGEDRETGNLEDAIAVLEMIVPFAEEKDVLICLENHAGNTFENIEDYTRIFSSVSSSHVGLCIDTGHFEAAGVRLQDVIDTFHDRINHIHVKENRQFGRKQFVRFGEGETDNAYVVERMLSYGYGGYVDIELSPEIIGADGKPETLTEADLRKAVDMFSRYADQR